MSGQEVEQFGLEVRAGIDAGPIHILGCCRADAMKLHYRELRDERGPFLGVVTAWPFCLSKSLAILARNLLWEISADALSPVTCMILAHISKAISVAISIA